MLKIVAGALTGSVAILTEAIHSGIDLIASIVAYASIRHAEVPADKTHRYGHEKFENIGAAVEGVLVLLGSAVIAYSAIHSFVVGPHVEAIPVGIAIVAFTTIVNLVISTYLYRHARQTGSPALGADAAHLRADALTSIGVLVALGLIEWTGMQWFDPAIALVIAGAIIVTGLRISIGSWRVLVDEALPSQEIQMIQSAIEAFTVEGVIGYHQLRTRRAGTRRYIDLHVQFEEGTSLEAAHDLAHRLQAAIVKQLPNADVLIHLEPAGSVHPDSDD